MNKVRYALLASAVLCIAIARPAYAETLGEAIADAYRNNPQLEAQRADLRALDERVIQAGAPYRLNLGITGSLTYSTRLARLFDAIGGGRGPFRDIEEKTLGISLTANQILSNGGRTAAQVSVAEANVLSGRERLREVENFILLEVVDSYASVRRDTELVAIQEQTVASYDRQVNQAEARERGGDLTRTDIAQAQAQALIVRTQLAQSRANLEQSRARFATVVGRSPGVLDPEPSLPGLPISVDSAYKVAESESPSILQYVLNEKAARSQIAAERAERRPIVSVEGRFGYNNNSSYVTRDLGRAVVGIATVTVPLAQGGLVGSRIREAIAREQQSGFQIEAARRSIFQSVQNSWNQSVTARDLVSSGEEAVTAAQNALRGVRKGFSEGFRSNFEVLDSEQRLLNAQLIVANARYSRFSSQASLLAYLGRLQAAAVLEAIPVYDAAANLKRRKAQQIEPFGPLVKTLDNLQVPGHDAPVAGELPPATAPVVAPAQVPPPSGPLVTGTPSTTAAPASTPNSASVPTPAEATPTTSG